MVLRRALVTAPLAVVVALAAHAVGFGSDHVFGGAQAGGLLALGAGGSVLLALLGLGWLTLSGGTAQGGARRLYAFLPGSGLAGNAAFLAGSGFIAFAAGEALEGRSPFGTWATALGILVAALAVAALSRAVARWLGAGAFALAGLVAAFTLGAPRSAPAFARRRPAAAQRIDARGVRRGRAPPPFA
jgi:hypothetical protein